jgi:predicted PolB exonuclease-like 3'-5' exonuclease
MGPCAGFLIKGKAIIESSGPDYELIKTKFALARAVMDVTRNSIKQIKRKNPSNFLVYSCNNITEVSSAIRNRLAHVR